MMRFLITPLVILLSTSLNASDLTNVKITRVHMYKLPAPSGGVFIQTSEKRDDNKCPGSAWQYFIDLNKQPRGSLLYTHAMTALREGYNVKIKGSNKCEGHARVESIDDLQIYK